MQTLRSRADLVLAPASHQSALRRRKWRLYTVAIGCHVIIACGSDPDSIAPDAGPQAAMMQATAMESVSLLSGIWTNVGTWDEPSDVRHPGRPATKARSARPVWEMALQISTDGVVERSEVSIWTNRCGVGHSAERQDAPIRDSVAVIDVHGGPVANSDDQTLRIVFDQDRQQARSDGGPILAFQYECNESLVIQDYSGEPTDMDTTFWHKVPQDASFKRCSASGRSVGCACCLEDEVLYHFCLPDTYCAQ
jgi:hypothetical protein